MPKVAIAGAGLVGALHACYFSQRGWDVEVYELRRDIRTMEHVPGRSINLALSYRGKCALEAVGLKDYIVKQGVEMHARLVHNKDGKTFCRQSYGQPGEHIVSINRRELNEAMISLAERSPKVKFFFEHKVVGVDLNKKEMTVISRRSSRIPKPGQASPTPKDTEIVVKADLLVASDGAYSAVRRSLAAQPKFNYSQEYIGHGYVELNVLPKNGDVIASLLVNFYKKVEKLKGRNKITTRAIGVDVGHPGNSEFALDPNVFHVWPRGDLTLIALANRDKTFTVTLFAPFCVFEEKLSAPSDVEMFFQENFPDAYELLGRDHLLDTFRRVPPQHLLSIKCQPHDFGDFVLLTGDAAHAMSPFYGQGMNCGFEDCLVLKETLDTCDEDIPKTLKLYSKNRVKDTHTIIDLALYNYEELRDLVNHPSYKLRKKLDLFLNRWLPKTWIPLYSMVTFTRIPYHKAVEYRQWQDKILPVSLEMINIRDKTDVLVVRVERPETGKDAETTVDDRANIQPNPDLVVHFIHIVITLGEIRVLSRVCCCTMFTIAAATVTVGLCSARKRGLL